MPPRKIVCCLFGLIASTWIMGCTSQSVPSTPPEISTPPKVVPASQEAPKPALNPPLSLVPADAAGFVHVRLANLWNSPGLADLRSMLGKAGPQAWQLFEQKYVPAPSTIQSLTVIFLTPESFGTSMANPPRNAISPLVVTTTAKPYDLAELRKALGTEMDTSRYNGHDYFRVWMNRTAVVAVNERTFVLGSEMAIQQWLARPSKNPLDGPLAAALVEANQNHHVVWGVHAASMPKEMFGPFLPIRPNTTFKVVGVAPIGGINKEPVKPTAPPWPDFVQPLLQARCATVTLDLDKELRGTLKLDFASEEQASAGRKGMRATLDAGVLALDGVIAAEERQLRDGSVFTFVPIGQPKEQARGPKALPRELEQASSDAFSLLQLGFYRGMKDYMQALAVEQKERSVRVEAHVPMNANTLLVAISAVTALGQNANSTFSTVGDKIGPRPDEKK